MPYPRIDHRNGNFNHGYLQLKGNVGAVSLIPEAQGWPELERFLEEVNADSSPIETVGCEKSFFSDGVAAAPPVYVGSYFDLVFTESALNDEPENSSFWRVASRIRSKAAKTGGPTFRSCCRSIRFFPEQICRGA